MKQGGRVGVLIFTFLAVLASVYAYNRFVAPAGKSIADLGKKAA
jgi:hypothetical protein